ncbi:iron-sulfur cluster repair di-iron protein ScdA [Desulfuromonas soudanensis]|uniref:Iron-sulfur cluster repair di-iron protein ScdA n=1 Tax=Desulfuromonas soudanensis TaxID=1603606 RepID=A0A0M4CZ20_9BACT|nr:iron-sulfur cluster repair di-iron protein [Desulfuromonas soudanensis]ALC15690.1 iron-sulfur cluster repair di-iron protein ScdA [Desulfuromonas soudanensis]
MTENKRAQTTDSANKTIGEFVAEDYRTATVFEGHGIDFCCGGQATLAEACQAKGVDSDALLKEMEGVKSAPIEGSRNYGAWELPFLADYIVNTHHAYLNENTGQIAAYADKIAGVHGAHHPEVVEISAIFRKIAADLADHLREEEEVLFPAVKRIEMARKSGGAPEAGDVRVIRASLEKLQKEHEEIGDAVHAIRRLARDYAIPADACNTFVLTYRKLEEFENDLHMHVHLENNILFPKAARPC